MKGLFPDVSDARKGLELQTSRGLRRQRSTQMSDFKARALMLPAMPGAKELLADKGYDADWFREALANRKIAACIPSKSNRKAPIPYDAVLYEPGEHALE